MDRGKSKPFKLTNAALEDLRHVWRHGSGLWSEDRATSYVVGLYEALERLSLDPAIVRERREFDPPIRVYRYQSHVIIYREHADRLEIVRIRHGREDWAGDPGG